MVDTPRSNGEAMSKATIQVGTKTFTATLLDNASTQALQEQLPLTFAMIELNGNEKYVNLTARLPTDPQRVGNIETGDLMLYGSDCLVLFYQGFQSSYSYTRLGRLDDTAGLSDALGKGNVRVMVSL